MDALIRLDDLTKRYDTGGRAALDGVRLQVAAGEAVVVMGPWGSGKSALLSLVADPDRPTRGMVTVAGQRIDSLSETGVARFRRRQAGMIFRSFNLLDDLTVAGNVLLPAQLARAAAPATWAAGSRTAPALRRMSCPPARSPQPPPDLIHQGPHPCQPAGPPALPS